MINKALLDAYLWNRRADRSKLYPRPKGPVTTASEAIERARFDLAANRTRYPSDIYPAVCWQPNEPGKAYVNSDISKAGLRFVGRVNPDGYGRDLWDNSESCGWHTDPHGDVFKDGTGLCYGVVYQLPGRKGKARFVAGYIFGGCSDDLPTVGLTTIYESDDCRDYYNSDPKDLDAAKEAARAADSMAQRAAENEREYQTAWQAGSKWADTQSEMMSDKRQLKEILAERRAVKGKGDYPALCLAIRSTVERLIERIQEGRNKLEKLANGDSDHLCFYPGEQRLKDAFNEAAGKTVLT